MEHMNGNGSVASSAVGDQSKGGEGLEEAIRVDRRKLESHLSEMVRSTVETTLNQLLDAEADEIAPASQAAV